MNRRSVLVGAGLLAVGIGGWRYRDHLEGIVAENLGPPKTDTPTNEMGGDAFLKRFVL